MNFTAWGISTFRRKGKSSHLPLQRIFAEIHMVQTLDSVAVDDSEARTGMWQRAIVYASGLGQEVSSQTFKGCH